MINPNTIYNVTGRYMSGQKVIAYHLVGEDGSQAQESKERVIYLIGKGVIANMRTQTAADNEIILRGKGINLNKLPVFDQNKQQFRNNDISQAAANTKVPVKNSVEHANAMGQYRILRRIMYKSKCLGYEVQDYSGAITRKKREDVIKLAIQKLISNAVAQKYKAEEDKEPRIILRGVDCDLGKLPILIVNEQGKIVDPTKDASKLTVRSAYMKRSGIIHDKLNNTDIKFKAGDFILCGANGQITIKDRLVVEKEYTKDTESNKALCDDYLDVSSNYMIEIFGAKPVQLTSNMIKSWVILKPVKA
ncbi:MAG: hypothetical protein J6A59_07710 [Lachnospiraceae bacterium]|nr:hypothetical protein [Lachnospiraceae bacterium]